MRYFIKFSVEYYRFSENNSNFAAVLRREVVQVIVL